jgi:hypothetical protein
MQAINTPRVFQERTVPQSSRLAGFSALVHAFALQAPVRTPSCTVDGSVKGSRRLDDGWTVFDRRFTPQDTLAGHLSFALRHEIADLLILKRLFSAVPKKEIEAIVRSEPTGATAHRIWFFYEWLTKSQLDVPDVDRGNYVDAIDPKEYFTATPVNSTRHRVRDNLLGVPDFCPFIRRTPNLEETAGSRWDTRAKELVGRINKGVIARAASFLLLADSQASYQIEGERPPRNRLERWMRAVAQAGKRPLSIEELVRLQHIVIEEARFIKPGLRDEGGFIGDRDWDNNPLPEFVSARHEDVPSLLLGIIDANSKMAASGLDAVLQATGIAFGFAFVHPFVDGNGRLHRHLIHHVLAERGYTPPGLTFPVSSVLLDREEEYARHLRDFTAPLLPFIDWVPTQQKNVHVTNDTADLYRYGDYTELAEFLYECVVRTIKSDLPREISYLKSFDDAKKRIQDFIEMPDAMISNLIIMITQNNGRLSKKRRAKEFAAMTDDEVAAVEEMIRDAFEGGKSGPSNGL